MVDAAMTPPRTGEGSGISPPSRFGKGAGGLGLRSHALGIFICFQLLYLPAANFIKLVVLRLPESRGELDDDIQLRGQQFPERLQTLADATGTAFVRWGELTGQAQGWSLFAPIFGHQASLPALSLNDPVTY